MPLFHKPKLPATTPPPPAEQVQRSTSKPKSRILPAPSTALSVGSAPYDARDKSSDDATVQGRDSGWQTAYGAARMAVEIAKESSDAFLPLKAVVGAISVLIKNCDQTSDNVESVKDIERRVQSLSGLLASRISGDDHAERWRRAVLRSKLEGVVAKLEPLSDQHAFIRFLRNVDDAKTLSGFVQELVNAITDYQVSVQQGVYDRTRNIHDDTKNILESADLEILARLEPVRDAGYQAGHHDKCLPGTRQSVLHDIMNWATSPRGQNVFWLNGLAGTGKSTIAQSFSEAIANEGFLGASFFCSRDYLDRRGLKNILPTLAYQLAYRYPRLRTHIITVIKKDPSLAHASLISQLENLLVSPLYEAKVSCVVVIDALDECIDDQPASAVLSVLGRFAKRLPLVKFFITGRPEPRIRTGFRLPLLEPITHIFLLHEVELSSVDNDIQLYLTQKLTTIAKRRSDLDLPHSWPGDGEIMALTKKSSGLFVFASTLARFIESEYHDPSERLQLVLSEASGTTHEGRAGIDFLYSQVLLHAFSDVRESEVFANVKRVLGAIVFAFNPLSRRDLSKILGVSMTLVSTTLRHLHSVILVPADERKEIRVFHKSFPDFLQDENRCTDHRFRVDPATYHGDMVLGCLELVKELERNPCSLPPFTMNRDVSGLPQLLEDRLGGAMRYACRYWARHLDLSPNSGDYIHQVTISVTEMLGNAPPWIEVMSLDNHLEEVIHSMYGLLDWRDKVIFIARESDVARKADAAWGPDAIWQKAVTTWQNLFATQKADAVVSATTALRDLATDCLRLSMHFFHPIQQCAQQIYHSALPLSPTSSQLRKSCLQSVIHDGLSYVTAFSGAPDAWGLLLRIIEISPRRLTCITTFPLRIVAACGDVVNIYDAVTFVLRQSLSTPEMARKIHGSPNGSILFAVHSLSVTMWDVQTGGLIHTFTTRSRVNDTAVSTTGDHIACGLSDGSVAFWTIRTKKEIRHFGNGQPVVTILWLSATELAVATQNSVYVWDIAIHQTPNSLPTADPVWGMVHLKDASHFLVGTSRSGKEAGSELCTLECVKHAPGHLDWQHALGLPTMTPLGRLTCPTFVDNQVACIAPPSGVRSFNTESRSWNNNLPLLSAARSIAVSSNRNLAVQTKDSIQIFSVDVLKSGAARENIHSSYVYPLGEKHIICVLKSSRHIILLELETLQKLHPGDEASPPELPPTNLSSSRTRASCSRRSIVQFDVLAVMQAWQSRTPLHGWTEASDWNVPLGGLSPSCTRIVIASYVLYQRELCVKYAKNGATLARIPLKLDGLGVGKVYDLTFDSETRFHLKIDGPGWHIQIPYDIIPSSSGTYSHTITQGEPVPLSEPRVKPPYTLNAKCEWVIDADSRKICWIPPGNVRRGSGGHFWAGPSLVMVGSDGIVRKLTFKEPDC